MLEETSKGWTLFPRSLIFFSFVIASWPVEPRWRVAGEAAAMGAGYFGCCDVVRS